MLTTLSILSLDQGKIWVDPRPLPRGDGATTAPDEASVVLEALRSFLARSLKWGMPKVRRLGTLMTSA